MNDERHNKLLELINEYGEYQYESGAAENASGSIGQLNSAEEVFNEILELVDKLFADLENTKNRLGKYIQLEEKLGWPGSTQLYDELKELRSKLC